jgi:hypothetical protein
MSNPGNPFSQMLIEKKPNLFYGRDSLIISLIQGISAQEPRSQSIFGPRTFGKTTLMHFLKHPDGAMKRYPDAFSIYGVDPERPILFVYIDFYKIPGAQMLSHLYEHLMSDIEIRNCIQENIGDDIPKRVMKIFNQLNEQKVRLVVLMDHFDTAFETLEMPIDLFMRSLTNIQTLIIATEHDMNELRKNQAYTSPLVNILYPRRLGGLTENEARNMINQSLNSQLSFSDAEVDYILRASGLQPFLIAIFGEYFYHLHCQYAEVQDFFSDPGFCDQVNFQLIDLPSVTELFGLYWKELDPTEQTTLFEIASGQLQNSSPNYATARRLDQKGMVRIQIPGGQFVVYSDLFRAYILQQRLRAEHRGLEKVITELSDKDKNLYLYFINNPDRIIPFDELMKEVWGNLDSKKGLEAAVHRLRIRLKDAEGSEWEYIQNVRKKGFQYRSRQD